MSGTSIPSECSPICAPGWFNPREGTTKPQVESTGFYNKWDIELLLIRIQK